MAFFTCQPGTLSSSKKISLFDITDMIHGLRVMKCFKSNSYLAAEGVFTCHGTNYSRNISLESGIVPSNLKRSLNTSFAEENFPWQLRI